MSKLTKSLLESFDSIEKPILTEETHGINDIRKMFKACGLKDIKETYDRGSRTYTIKGLYNVKIGGDLQHLNNILFESYDLPVSFIVYVLKDGEGKSTRVRGYKIKIVGVDRALDVTNEFSVYADDFMNVQNKIKQSIIDYAEYINYGISKAIKENIDAIDKPEATSMKNGLYTGAALSKFIAVVRDFINDKDYAPTNVIARLEDTPDYTDKAYNESEETGTVDAREVLPEMLGRSVSSNLKGLKVGYKWWDWRMQEDFENLINFFNLGSSKLEKAIKTTDPFERKSDEEVREALDFIRATLEELATRMKEYLDNKGATNYRISRIGEYQGQSRMVVFSFYSFRLTII